MSESVLTKLNTLRKIVKQNGGVWGSLKTLYRIDDLKDGEFVGVDRNGNRYFQNDRFFVGRNRWVIYNEKYGLDYDGSQIDPVWHGWIHYMTDEIPKSEQKLPKFVTPPGENKTLTNDIYVPYSTTRPKIESWIPPQKPNKQ